MWSSGIEADVVLYGKTFVRQEQFVAGTNLDEAIIVVDAIYWYRKSASDVPLHFSLAAN